MNNVGHDRAIVPSDDPEGDNERRVENGRRALRAYAKRVKRGGPVDVYLMTQVDEAVSDLITDLLKPSCRAFRTHTDATLLRLVSPPRRAALHVAPR